MANISLPNPDNLRKAIDYDPETGLLVWKERNASFFSDNDEYGPARRAKMWNSLHAGKLAFNYIGARGYKHGSFGGKVLTAHRVAWAVFYGSWPDAEIDHIDGCRINNAITNLRNCSTKQNAQNRRARGDNHPGLQWRPDIQKWTACITVDYQTIYLGSFASKDDAESVRKAAESEYGFHPNHGRRCCNHNTLPSQP